MFRDIDFYDHPNSIVDGDFYEVNINYECFVPAIIFLVYYTVHSCTRKHFRYLRTYYYCYTYAHRTTV